MSFKEFNRSEIESSKQKYAAEAKERWGSSSAFIESEKRTAAYGKEDWRMIEAESAEIMQAFASHIGTDPEASEVQSLVKRWQGHISARFYLCTNEILQGLGEMYTQDERFTKNINQHGEGTAALMAQAISIYCEK